ncbi:MAG: tetratricopeptide repeat protein [Bacteroidaceae bacterium]
MDYNQSFEKNKENEEDILAKVTQYEKQKADTGTVYFDADDFIDIADYYFDTEEEAKGNEVLDYALSIHPDNTELLVFKSHILLDDDKVEEATRIANSIGETFDTDVKLLKAEIYVYNGQYKEADDLFHELEKETEDEEELVATISDIISVYLSYSYTFEAIPWLQKAIEQYPDNLGFHFQLADVFTIQKQTDKAIEIYNKLLDQDPYSIDCWLKLGKVYCDIEDFPKAIEAYDFALAIEANDRMALVLKADCYNKLENYEEANKIYFRLMELSPNSEIPYYMVGVNFIAQGDFAKAKEYLLQVEEKSDSYSMQIFDAYTSLAQCEEKLGNIPAAIKYIDKALGEDSSDPDLYMMKGHLFCSENKIVEGKKNFLKAEECADNNVEILINIVSHYLEDGLLSEAEHLCETILEIEPNNKDAQKVLKSIFIPKDKLMDKQLIMDLCGIDKELNTLFRKMAAEGDLDAKEIIDFLDSIKKSHKTTK